MTLCSPALAGQITFINLKDSFQLDLKKAIDQIQLVTSIKKSRKTHGTWRFEKAKDT
jgi:hypothetical protein